MTIKNIKIKETIVFLKLIGKDLSNRYEAKNTGSVILIISDVCKVKKPKSSHLFAPLISFPVNKVITLKALKLRRTIKSYFYKNLDQAGSQQTLE
ncbi:MAG: hypothetical protein Ct9H90mP22_0460 [Gammaproteobacteria bacterium]|nr:MAG: hypothetical protein Ct9H90mP22_0460 [Gammaproteobacteria bacterium]